MSSCVTRGHVLVCHKMTVFLYDKKTCFLVTQEDMFSCDIRAHALLWHKTTCFLVSHEISFLVSQEDMSSGPKGRNPEIKKPVVLLHWGRSNLGPPKLKNISLVYHVTPDPLNSLFYHFLDIDDLGAVGGHCYHNCSPTSCKNICVLQVSIVGEGYAFPSAFVNAT